MDPLNRVAPAFLAMAHRIVWATAATVDGRGRPRSRILHPIWQWNGERLIGWIATSPTPTKRAHLDAGPYISLTYWEPTHDTCTAECRVAWAFDLETRQMVWDFFLNAPPPVGYDPRIVPAWTSPAAEAFAVLKLDPWRLRVFPGSVMMGKGGELLVWREPAG